MNRIRAKYEHNLFAIIYFNFKMLPFKQAVKLPFDFYFKIRFQDLSGRVILNCKELRRGMFQWGFAEQEIFSNSECILSIKGKLIINDKDIAFGSGTVLEINENAILELNGDLVVAPRTKIILQEKITIGKHVRIGWESQLFDSNFHFMRNVVTGEIINRTKPVFIGDFCWIGNRVTINKGTVLPSHSIVASNSLCNKDYSGLDKYPTLAGCPVKQVGQDLERIFEPLEPQLINEILQTKTIK